MVSNSPNRSILVVGGSSGLGLALVRQALKAGHKVTATSRSISKSRAANPEVESLGGYWLELDITSDTTETVVTSVLEERDIDVVINSAGYAALGAFEDFTERDWKQQFDVNVMGVLRVCKAVVPIFRKRKSGVIVNIGSGAGLKGIFSRSLYAGSKFAVAGITESLASELQPFGVRVLLVEPGAFNTAFGENVAWPEKSTTAYDDTPMGELIRKARNGEINSKSAGDPDEAALRIIEAIIEQGLGAELGDCVRMILGSDCLTRLKQRIDELNVTYERNERIAPSTDHKE